jgi:hypothetical protein
VFHPSQDFNLRQRRPKDGKGKRDNSCEAKKKTPLQIRTFLEENSVYFFNTGFFRLFNGGSLNGYPAFREYLR